MAKANIPETGFVDYDGLLNLFCGNDDLRPAMKQPNLVQGIVYATDAHSVLLVPEKLVRLPYGCHEKVPNYHSVIGQVKECDPIAFSDSSLFKILAECPMDFDTKECEMCEGEGTCPHCGGLCPE